MKLGEAQRIPGSQWRKDCFLGFDPNECGPLDESHRTCGGRAWCHSCTEWCYPTMPCRGCELPALRAEVDGLRAERDDLRESREFWRNARSAEISRDLAAAVARAEEAEAERDYAVNSLAEAEARNTEVREWVEGQFEEYDGDPVEEDDYIAGTMEGARDICRGVLERLRGESAPDPQPAPCAHCDDRRIVCSYCAFDAATGSVDWYCGNPDGDPDAVPCPSCSASPGGEAP